MITQDQAKKMKSMRDSHRETGVVCKNCKHYIFVEKDDVLGEFGGCGQRMHLNFSEKYHHCEMVSGNDYCDKFFWKE